MSKTATVYERNQAQSLQTVRYGVIERVETVIIDGRSTAIGMYGGAAMGAAAAQQIGAGTGRDLAQVGAGILGAISGRKVEKAVTRKEGFDLEVLLDNGDRVVVIQEAKDTWFGVGDKVRVVSSYGSATVQRL